MKKRFRVTDKDGMVDSEEKKMMPEVEEEVPLYWALGVGHRFTKNVENLGWDRPTPWHQLSSNGARLKKIGLRILHFTGRLQLLP